MKRPAIRVRDFEKSFSGRVVHSRVSLEVAQGECLGLLGGSGAGKSVILRSLIGLERPDRGTIDVLDHPVHQMSESELVAVRRRVAYVFQGGALFDSMSVFDNLAYPLREHTRLSAAEIRARVVDTLEQYGLVESLAVYPARLSGGMQKRVGLARATILDPEVILYDEPTAGLDPQNTIRIQELIKLVKAKGTTSVLVTHDMPTALAVCDRIAFLWNGQIRAHGTVEELSADSRNPIRRFMDGVPLEDLWTHNGLS
jgi:phospholipid/cholesterol/gamma-HCH transport system ATP-binding protein